MNTGFPGLPGIDLNRMKKSVGVQKNTTNSNTQSFQEIMDRHLEEIGRSQIAYQEYKDHGRLDLANGAHGWAEKQRMELQNLGVSPDLYKEGIDLTERYRSKYTSQEAISYDFTQNGQVAITDYAGWQNKIEQAYELLRTSWINMMVMLNLPLLPIMLDLGE